MVDPSGHMCCLRDRGLSQSIRNDEAAAASKRLAICSSTCGRVSRVSSRAAIRAEREAALRAEREAIEPRRQERQLQDQLILDLWPEDEAYR